jgi:hypothetical protein
MKKRKELLRSPYYWEEKISNFLATVAGSKEIAEEITDRIKEYDKIVRLDDVSSSFCTCKNYNWVNATEDGGSLYCTVCELPVQGDC